MRYEPRVVDVILLDGVPQRMVPPPGWIPPPPDGWGDDEGGQKASDHWRHQPRDPGGEGGGQWVRGGAAGSAAAAGRAVDAVFDADPSINNVALVLDGIERVHDIPDVGVRVPIRVDSRLRRDGSDGEFNLEQRMRGNRQVELLSADIRLAKNGAPALTILHEVGHYVDAAKGNLSDSPQFQRAAFGTEAGRRLLRSDASYAAYKAQPDELFARAYAQWIATRSGDRKLQGRLRATRSMFRGYENAAVDWWEDDDFAPLDQYFTEVFGVKEPAARRPVSGYRREPPRAAVDAPVFEDFNRDAPTTTFYHVGPSSAEASILEHGLLPGGGGVGEPHPGQQWEPDFPGVYMFPPVGRAAAEENVDETNEADAEWSGGTGDAVALYEITIPASEYGKIREDSEGSPAFIDQVPPSWITVHRRPAAKPEPGPSGDVDPDVRPIADAVDNYRQEYGNWDAAKRSDELRRIGSMISGAAQLRMRERDELAGQAAPPPQGSDRAESLNLKRIELSRELAEARADFRRRMFADAGLSDEDANSLAKWGHLESTRGAWSHEAEVARANARRLVRRAYKEQDEDPAVAKLKAEYERTVAEHVRQREIDDELLRRHHTEAGDLADSRFALPTGYYYRTRREATWDVLRQLRPFGGELDLYGTERRKTDDQGAAELQAAAAWFPTEWIERSNADDRRKLFGTITRSRGHYDHTHSGRGNSPRARRYERSQIRVSAAATPVRGDSQYLDVAVHELGHRMEREVPHLREAEWALYQERTQGQNAVPLRKLEPGLRYRPDERARPDRFAAPYVGKTYGGTPTSSYELFTMGVAHAVTGSYHIEEKDPEHYQWTLGVLATL